MLSIGNVYNFGIVHITDESSFRHTTLCRGILLWYLLRKYKENNENKSLYNRCNEEVSSLLKQLNEINEIDETYTWLILPNVYIQCGKCLVLGTGSDEAFNYFEYALRFETSRLKTSTVPVKHLNSDEIKSPLTKC